MSVWGLLVGIGAEGAAENFEDDLTIFEGFIQAPEVPERETITILLQKASKISKGATHKRLLSHIF